MCYCRGSFSSALSLSNQQLIGAFHVAKGKCVRRGKARLTSQRQGLERNFSIGMLSCVRFETRTRVYDSPHIEAARIWKQPPLLLGVVFQYGGLPR